MHFEMYGIGCALCGRASQAWLHDRLWPCGCPAPALRPWVSEADRAGSLADLALAAHRRRAAAAEPRPPAPAAVPA
ncbi:hypothetical protein GCM10023200_27320 [Actinomycetospora chlora]|uniref:Uncharacterized protein n=1 Tax=Actinomycetospora chlora TaxID=663608 RepID=A0ABP9B505_9PSEU